MDARRDGRRAQRVGEAEPRHLLAPLRGQGAGPRHAVAAAQPNWCGRVAGEQGSGGHVVPTAAARGAGASMLFPAAPEGVSRATAAYGPRGGTTPNISAGPAPLFLHAEASVHLHASQRHSPKTSLRYRSHGLPASPVMSSSQYFFICVSGFNFKIKNSGDFGPDARAQRSAPSQETLGHTRGGKGANQHHCTPIYA